MMSKQAKVKIQQQKNSVTVEAEIPALDPRKGITPIRYDVTDAEAAVQLWATKKGVDVGGLISDSTVLENRPRTNRLHGTWTFKINRAVTIEIPKTNSRAQTRKRRTTSSRTTKKTTTTE